MAELRMDSASETSSDRRPLVAVVGAGPAGLMAAEILATSGCGVTAFDGMPSVARKFLLAGRGGLNLTHSEPADLFLSRYPGVHEQLARALGDFPASALVAWCEGLGVETFVGSSGRVFPKSLKASPLLRAWLRRLDGQGVAFRLRTRWTGFGDDGLLVFDSPTGRCATKPDATILALGGASWPRLGGDGAWVAPLAELGISIAPLRPANCGFVAPWSDFVSKRFQGEPIKRAALSFEGRTAKGEAVITADGIEGGLIYALSDLLREAIALRGEASPTLDLRPDLSAAALADRLARDRGARSLSTHLRKAAGLAPVAIALLREAGPVPTDPKALAGAIKAVPLRLVATKGLDRAISTAGGVPFSELDERFMLRKAPGVFLAGEMLDWEAPTGGYLLQATFATAVAAARSAAAWAKTAAGAG